MRFIDRIRKSADEMFAAFAGLDADFGHAHPARRGAGGPLREEFEAVRRGGELLASMRRIEALLERIAKAVEPKSADQIAAQLQADIRRGAETRYPSTPAKWWTRIPLACMVEAVLLREEMPAPEQQSRLRAAADFCMDIDTLDPTPEKLAQLDIEMSVLGVRDEQKLQAMQAIYTRARAEQGLKLLRVAPKPGERWLTPQGTEVIATETKTVDALGVTCLVMRHPTSDGYALFPLRTIDGFSAPGWVQSFIPLHRLAPISNHAFVRAKTTESKAGTTRVVPELHSRDGDVAAGVREVSGSGPADEGSGSGTP